MQIKKLLPLLFLCSFLTQCYYDKYTELQPSSIISASCDTSGTISYNRQIAPLLSESCGANNSCHNHSNSSGIDLGSYDAVKNIVNGGRLNGALEWKPGYVAMPQGAAVPLEKCKMTLLKNWIAQGAANN